MASGYKESRSCRSCKVQPSRSRNGRDECGLPPGGTTQGRSQDSEQHSNAEEQTHPRDEMPPGSRFAMLPNHGNLPEPILKILVKQRGQTGSGPIPGNNLWRLPDFSAGRNNTQIQFVVLIATKVFVEDSDAFQCGFAPAAVRYGVHVSFIFGIMELCSATGEPAVVGKRYCAPPISIRARQRRSSDIVREGFIQDFQATANVVRRILAVSVHSNDDFASGRANRGIEARGGNFVRIVDHTKRENNSPVQFQYLASAIIAHSVGDQNFDFCATQGLSANRIKQIINVLTFIAARNDDGYLDVFAWLHIRGPLLNGSSVGENPPPRSNRDGLQQPRRVRRCSIRLKSDSQGLRQERIRRSVGILRSHPHTIPLANADEGDPD